MTENKPRELVFYVGPNATVQELWINEKLVSFRDLGDGRVAVPVSECSDYKPAPASNPVRVYFAPQTKTPGR